jgi:hypothetical protein
MNRTADPFPNLRRAGGARRNLHKDESDSSQAPIGCHTVFISMKSMMAYGLCAESSK